MPTTTIRLPAELKTRVAAVAARVGTTSHNFILTAIAEKTAQEEGYGDFNAVAEQRYANIIATGQTTSWPKMRGYRESRLAGKVDFVKPTAKKLVR